MSKPPKIYDFKEQLAIGDKGEAVFKQYYHKPLTIIKERYADFKTRDGKILELKTDTYKTDETPNFYFERYSDIAKKSPGSVWQSLDKGVDILCYFFINSNTYFEFKDLPALRDCLDDYILDKSYVNIANRGWGSAGYKIPRHVLNHLWKRYVIVPKESKEERKK